VATVWFSCGCWITRSMFGKRQVLAIGVCLGHMDTAQLELSKAAEVIAGLERPNVKE